MVGLSFGGLKRLFLSEWSLLTCNVKKWFLNGDPPLAFVSGEQSSANPGRMARRAKVASGGSSGEE